MSDSHSLSGSSTSSGGGDDDGWLDADQNDQEESLAVVSLIDDKVFPDAASMLSDCKDRHRLDFLGIRDRLALDFYGTIRLVNFSELPPRSHPPQLSPSL